MNRLLTLVLIGLAGLLASCGSSITSSTKPAEKDEYLVSVSPDRFTLNSGDWATVTALVEKTHENGTPTTVSPQPTIKFYASDPHVTVSSSGEVCAGVWDSKYLNCTPASTLPTGLVTITAYDAKHNVSGTAFVSVHPRVASISLSAPAWGARKCISQNNQVQYVASPFDSSGNAIPTCSTTVVAGCVYDNDYTWSVDDTNVATVSQYGNVVAVNPGVTNLTARLNGTVSVPLAFATCPPSSILLQSSAYTNAPPTPPYSTADLTLQIGNQKYLSATLVDSNGNSLTTSPIQFITSNPLTSSFSTLLPLVSTVTANNAGRVTVTAACEPSTCNPSVSDFTSPAGATTGKAAGFGYPIYSNVIGMTVQGAAGSPVLVTGTTFTDGVTPAHKLLVYDSTSLAISHDPIELANLPNSLVVAPNGAKAYVGSDTGLIVVDLTSYQSSIRTYPITGGISDDVITGKVLGVSPDSRYVLISDIANGIVFLIDTTGTKAAIRYAIPGITAVAFAADSSNIWIGGNTGVYSYQADTFVPIATNASTHVSALTWLPDGQSYFATGDQLVKYSTCDDQNPQLLEGAPVSLSTTALNGVPHVLGLSGSTWYDYSVTTSAQAGATPAVGNVCLSTVTVNTPVKVASTLNCTANQVSFSPTLQREFVTGVNSSCATPDLGIHGYDVNTNSEFTLSTLSTVVPLSGGVLSDASKLFFGTYDSTAKTAQLHRIDLSTGTEDTATDSTTGQVTIPAPVQLVPSFVAVVPK